VGTIRSKLLKIGAVIVKNTRRIKVMMDSHFPEQDLFTGVAQWGLGDLYLKIRK